MLISHKELKAVKNKNGKILVNYWNDQVVLFHIHNSHILICGPRHNHSIDHIYKTNIHNMSKNSTLCQSAWHLFYIGGKLIKFVVVGTFDIERCWIGALGILVYLYAYKLILDICLNIFLDVVVVKCIKFKAYLS